jgi:hypothetical protein
MFLPDKLAAFAEVRRLPTADGAFLFTTWSTLDTRDF